MHKRNVALVALASTLGVAVLFALVPSLPRSDVASYPAWPAVFIAVALSDGNPGLFSAISGIIGATWIYLVPVVVVYAIVLEFYLVRRAFGHIDCIPFDIRIGSPRRPVTYLRRLGQALIDVESHRRKHWVLDDMTDINLELEPEEIAVAVLRRHGKWRSAQRLFDHLEASIASEIGPADAAVEMRRLRDYMEASEDGRPNV